MKKVIITLSVIIIAGLLAITLIGYNTNMSSLVQVVKSETPPQPTQTLPPVKLPADFPSVPLLNSQYVNGSYQEAVTSEGKKTWKVSVFGNQGDIQAITAQYQAQGYTVSNPNLAEPAPFVTLNNGVYNVVVTGANPYGHTYTFAYVIQQL